jgi:hypothetical protein
MIERCSGHDGTYGVRAETFEKSQKIARPVINRAQKAAPTTWSRLPDGGLADCHTA